MKPWHWNLIAAIAFFVAAYALRSGTMLILALVETGVTLILYLIDLWEQTHLPKQDQS